MEKQPTSYIGFDNLTDKKTFNKQVLPRTILKARLNAATSLILDLQDLQ